ncbi:ABC transporter substrate-binding protein [Xanthobacter dioxanivorans]|uniref:ABC transporter substrate-binding protein n=1 Tax=Xanthobacter dioxanivorans TaxID=2528964 RepID=A0A974SK15_9HYPH|nr:ABC transporter substrate-binding protein [Xanthobacter dioxanivorans]QRG07028.1 ABC transporter substrate-binding protein [Xanthobacter dioxanivorans]
MRVWSRLAALFAACVLLAAPATAQTVKVGLLMIGNPLVVGVEKGFFKEYGVDVEPVYFRSGAEQIPALSTGTVDVILSSATASLFNAIASGVDMKIVADYISLVPGTAPHGLLVREELMASGKVKTVADLKGRSIGVTAVGVYTHQAAVRILKSAGLTEKDVRLVNMPYPDMVAALANGAIDAANMTEPFVTQAREMGVARLLLNHTEAFPNLQLGVTIYGPRLATRDRDLGERFMRGLVKSMQYMRGVLTDPARTVEVAAIMQKSLPVKDPKMYERMSWQLTTDGQKVNLPSLQEQLDFYAAQKLIPKMPNLAAVTDTSFLERAHAR